MVKLDNLATESRNELTKDLDLLSTRQILEIMNSEDKKVIEAVKDSLDEIEILVCLNSGDAASLAWGCDLTYDYVKINGDYRT